MFIIYKYITNIIIVFVASLLIICTSSWAEIIIVKTKGGIKSYELAADGFRSVINEKIIEFDMEKDHEKGKKIAKEIKKLMKSENPPSLILTIGLMASKLINEEIKGIPVIFSMVFNPKSNGLTGRKNLGGVSFDLTPEAQLTRLQKIVPTAKNIGVIYDKTFSENIIERAKESASHLNLTIVAKEISSLKEVPDAINTLIKKINVLWLIPDSTVINRESFKFINLKALENRIPVMSFSPQLVKMGSPFCFFSDEFSVGRQAGIISLKVLNGEIKENIPIESPKDISLAINTITMKKCGIELLQDVIDSAKEIYE